MFSNRLKEQATHNGEESINNVNDMEFLTFTLNDVQEGEFEDPFVAYESAMEDVYKARTFLDVINKYKCVPSSLVSYLNADGSLAEYLPLTFSYAGQGRLDTFTIESIAREIDDVVGTEAAAVKFAKQNFNAFYKMLAKNKGDIALMTASIGAGFALGDQLVKRTLFLPKKDLVELIESLSNMKNAISDIDKANLDERITEEVANALDSIPAFSLRVEKEKYKIIEGRLPDHKLAKPSTLGYDDSSLQELTKSYENAIDQQKAAIDEANIAITKISNELKSAESDQKKKALEFKHYALATVMKRAHAINAYTNRYIKGLATAYTNDGDMKKRK